MQSRTIRLSIITASLFCLACTSHSQVDTSAEVAKAKQLKQQGQLPEARRILEEALGKAPDHVEAHYVLAWVLVAQGQNGAGGEHFRKVLQLSPNTDMARDAEKALRRLGLPVTAPAGTPQQPPPAGEPAAPTPQPPAPEPAAQQGPLKTQMIDDFEANDNAWYGLQRMAEAAGTGKAGGAWLDTATVPSVMTHALKGGDWSDFTHLQFDCNSAAANDALITIALKSDNPNVDGNDFYWLRLRLNWTGWKVLQIPLTTFTASGKPIGFTDIQNIMMASNWGPCKPLPDTVLYFDNFQLVKLAPTQSPTLGNMDDDIDFWQGLAPETTLVKEGQQAGRWEKLDEIPSLRYGGEPHDWTPFGALHLWLHSAAANGQELKIAAWSDSPETKEMDGFRCDIKVDWQGWKELRLTDADFMTSYRPRGWDKISSLDIVGAGWGGMAPPRADTVLVLDDVRLEPADAKQDLAFMDFDTTQRAAFSEENAITDEAGHGGKHSLCWRPRRRPSIGFANIPHDWSSFDALSFWVKTDLAEEVTMRVALISNRYTPEFEDHYWAMFKVPPRTWTQILIPIKSLQPEGKPLGLDSLQRMYFFGGESRSAEALMKGTMYFDDFMLVRGTK